jgi:hypothetical protein
VEKFRKSINLRKNILCVYILVVSWISASQQFIDFGFTIPEHVWGFGFGLMVGADVIAVYFLVIYMRAMQDESKLQALYILETDERNVMIRTKTGGMAVNIIMAMLVCAALVAGIFSEIVFYTLIATLLFIALLKGTLKLYYRKKI